jgi:CheY-like chemotaxis protein/predicted regulator of Ras-like GTPase activity (Roadblock/LC7/MglB family)
MTDESKRVLIVDDEDDLTWSISKHLAKDKSQYELICVNSGKKALDVLSQVPVDLVISDIRMPEISGLDLLVKIKDYYPTTKVIIMTAYGSSEIHEEANKRGCFKYIEKPFEINDLRQLILEGIAQKKGFKGTITDFQLSDLIQMNCLGRVTSALYVSQDENRGVIYFSEGNIVHAEYGEIEGEDALYEMLSWSGGNFTSKRGEEAKKETIIKGWQSLLIEGMRRLDEHRRGSKLDMSDDHVKATNKMNLILDKMISQKGALLVSIFDPEGFPIASRMNKQKNDITIREITPVISNLLKQVDGVAQDLKVNSSQEIMVDFGNAVLNMFRIKGKKEFLIFLATDIHHQGVMRMQAKKEIRNLSEIF